MWCDAPLSKSQEWLELVKAVAVLAWGGDFRPAGTVMSGCACLNEGHWDKKNVLLDAADNDPKKA